MTGTEPIAIVGMACRFPGGVTDPGTFWELLRRGVDAITEVPEGRWNAARFHHPNPAAPGRMVSKWGGFVDNVDMFDAAFFGIAPREAARIDPQHRWLAEVTWEAIEDGGMPPEQLTATKTAVFIGISHADYPTLHRRDRLSIDGYVNIGSALSIAANRLSFLFNFRGPSVAVDTACSSSLVALHLAARSLSSGECDYAVVGGANALLSPEASIGLSQARMLSPRGRCRAFDAGADGYVRAEGAAAVLLMRLPTARSLGLSPRALLLATASNQDGRSSSLTVPNQDAQEALIREALQTAEAHPADVSYVEAHGTGTTVGDRIEVRAVAEVLANDYARSTPLLLGSVKTNLGHLESASGLAGLIKAVLVLEHREVPPNLHFETPNPRLPLGRITVPTALVPLPSSRGQQPLVAVNSFGFGGTNAHALLAPAPSVGGSCAQSSDGVCLFPTSARAVPALRAYAESFARLIDQDKPASFSLPDLCAASSLGKSHHSFRRAFVTNSLETLQVQLIGLSKSETPIEPANKPPKIAFVFSGQGSQWWAMGRELYNEENVVREIWAECDRICRELGGPNLLDELLAAEADSRLYCTDLAQPALFALQAGIVQLWRKWGIDPDFTIGHSVGEAAAAWAAGICDLEEILQVVVSRSRWQHKLRGQGRMLAAAISAEEAASWERKCRGRISIAAFNAPRQITLSGDADAVEEIAAALKANHVFVRLLPGDYPFHSDRMDVVKDGLCRELNGLAGRIGKRMMISTVTGEPVRGTEIDAEYWWRNVRQPVRFATAIERALAEGCDAFVEIGPHPVMSSALTEIKLGLRSLASNLASSRKGENERETMLRALGALYEQGASVRWNALYQRARLPFRLPAYPWQRQRLWQESATTTRDLRDEPPHPLLGDRQSHPQPTWLNQLDLRLIPWLADHRVGGAAVLPAAAYLEMAAAAVREFLKEPTIFLEDIRFHRLLFLPAEQPIPICVRLNPAAASFEITAVPNDAGGKWEVYAEGLYRPGRLRSPVATDLTALDAAMPQERDPNELYRLLNEMGQIYGPAFRGMTFLRLRGKEAALCDVADQIDRGPNGYLLFPPSFDSCLHASVALKRDNGLDSRAVVVSSIRQIVIHRPMPGAVRSHLRIVRRWRNTHLGDLTIHDRQGNIVAQVDGLKLQAIEAGAEAKKGEGKLYRFVWEQAPAAVSANVVPSRVIVFADNHPAADQLAADLRGRRMAVTMVRESDSSIHLKPGTVAVNTSEEGWADTLWSTIARRDVEPDTIVYLWGRAGEGNDCEKLLSLIQARLRMGTADRIARWIVATHKAQCINTTVLVSPGCAAVWGFVRTLQTEQPQWRVSLVDCDDDDATTPLINEVFASEVEPEVALHKSGRWVRRLRQFQLPGELKPSTAPAFALAMGAAGRIDTLAFQGRARRQPGRGQIEIETCAAGLNFRDLMKALGIYPLRDGEAITFGDEFAGLVTRVGRGVRIFKIGDRVVGLTPGGAFASHLVVPAGHAWKLPPHLSLVEGASIPMVFGTAYHALHTLARLRAGETILIHAAAGGVGLAAVQLAQRLGAIVIATAGNDEKRAYLRSLGVALVLDSRTLDFAGEVLRFTDGRGVDVVLNSLAGAFQHKSLAICAPHGRFVEIGKRDLFENNGLPIAPFQRSLAFFAFDLGSVLTSQPSQLAKFKSAISRGFSAKKLQPVPITSFPADEADSAFRMMQRAQQIGKVVLRFEKTQPTITPEFWPNPDATYFITGGLSGFGLSTAEWLAERGARHLALISRRGKASAENQLILERLQRQNVSVMTFAADVTDAHSLGRVLRRIKKTAPPIHGIFHAAMVLADRTLNDMTTEDLRSVLAPKITGAWNLHMETRDLPLDYFVLYSSVSCLFGTPAQANYAAANAFLDALAHYRRASGLPGLSVNWSQIADAGVVAARPEIGRFLEHLGVKALPARNALALLARLMAGPDAQVAIMNIDWQKLSRASAKFGSSPIFRDLVREESGASGDGPAAADWRTVLFGLPLEKRLDAVCDLVTAQVATTLGTAVSDIDPKRPLRGMDSLMAVELKVRMETQTASELPIDLFNADLSITDLGEKLLMQLQKTTPQAATVTSDSSDNTSATGGISAPLLRSEDRPLSELICSGKMEKLAAAALMSWPDSLFAETHIPANVFLERLNGRRVSFDLIFETTLGSVGIFMLPLTTAQVKPGEPTLMHHVLEGLTDASACGARCVALTGLIASATNYGMAVQAARHVGHTCTITTGHNTTIAAVVLNLAALLDKAGRELPDETVMFYGIGSIGLGALRLMLDVLPHPAELRLCDPFRSTDFFAQLKEALRRDRNFKGRIRVVAADFFSQECDATVIVGATNTANVLDARVLRPGTLMVDDSAPHCLNGPAVFSRFRAQHDILCTEGGFVRSPGPMPRITHVPDSLAGFLPRDLPDLFLSFLTPYDITACILSALLSAARAELAPTIGLSPPRAVRQHWDVLHELGFTAAELNYEGTPLDAADVAAFRQQFNKHAMSRQVLMAS